MCGGVLELREGLVLGEALSEVLGALRSDAILLQTASATTSQCQWGLTAGFEWCGGVLERREGLVLGEALGEMLGALRSDVVAAEPASKCTDPLLLGVKGMELGREATYSSVCNVEFVWSARPISFAPSAPILLSASLRAKAQTDCYGVLKVGAWRTAAYFSEARLLFSLRAMAIACPPSAPMLL